MSLKFKNLILGILKLAFLSNNLLALTESFSLRKFLKFKSVRTLIHHIILPYSFYLFVQLEVDFPSYLIKFCNWTPGLGREGTIK